MHRLERTTDGADRHKKIVCRFEKVGELLVDLFGEAFDQLPERIVLDLDVTDTPLHGEQEGRFFHGYYGHCCYLPLYISAGSICCTRGSGRRTKTPRATEEKSRGSSAGFGGVWPQARIILRADSGSAREELMA